MARYTDLFELLSAVQAHVEATKDSIQRCDHGVGPEMIVGLSTADRSQQWLITSSEAQASLLSQPDEAAALAGDFLSRAGRDAIAAAFAGPVDISEAPGDSQVAADLT